MVLELNARDDRGINVVQTRIKDFAAVAVGSGQCQGIIEPLASRCAKFRFKPLSEEITSSRILHICNEEGLTLDAEALSTLSSISQGDLCRAITYLQGAARLFGSSISSKDLISVSGAIPQEVTEALYEACKSGDFDLANKEVNNIIAEGYPVSQILAQLFEVVVEADDLSNERKACMCKSLATADKVTISEAHFSCLVSSLTLVLLVYLVKKNKITVFALAVSNLGGSVLLPIANHSSENVKWLLFFLDKNGYKRWGAV
eukprot:XP_024450514.1 replication factor C subunit 2 isoform X3 [Populus trichocarpa]